MRLDARLGWVLAILAGLNAFVGASDAAAEEKSWFLRILDSHRKAVFRLEVRWVANDGGQCDLPDQGTGFLISNRGHIVTATHLLEKKNRKADCRPEILAYPDAGSSISYKARLIKSISTDVVSVIQMTGYDSDTTLKISDSKVLQAGHDVFYMGYPGGTWSFNIGKLTNINDAANLFLVEMPSGVGASGAPVFDRCGGVVGVVIGRPDSRIPGQTHFYPLELAANLQHLGVRAPPCNPASAPLVTCRIKVAEASSSVITRSTGWRGGGYSPKKWCDNLLETVRAEQPAATVSIVPNSAVEDSRDTCPPFNCRQYNYTCSVKVYKEAQFEERQLPSCP